MIILRTKSFSRPGETRTYIKKVLPEKIPISADEWIEYWAKHAKKPETRKALPKVTKVTKVPISADEWIEYWTKIGAFHKGR